jgi:hypothetical protein
MIATGLVVTSNSKPALADSDEKFLYRELYAEKKGIV